MKIQLREQTDVLISDASSIDTDAWKMKYDSAAMMLTIQKHVGDNWDEVTITSNYAYQFLEGVFEDIQRKNVAVDEDNVAEYLVFRAFLRLGAYNEALWNVAQDIVDIKNERERRSSQFSADHYQINPIHVAREITALTGAMFSNHKVSSAVMSTFHSSRKNS